MLFRSQGGGGHGQGGGDRARDARAAEGADPGQAVEEGVEEHPEPGEGAGDEERTHEARGRGPLAEGAEASGRQHDEQRPRGGQAEAAGARPLSGLGMLIYQGIESLCLWTGRPRGEFDAWAEELQVYLLGCAEKLGRESA